MGGGTRGSRTVYAASGSYDSNIKTYGDASNTGVKRVFISFHIDDEAQVNFLRAQAKEGRTDLDFIDYSVKEPFDEAWKTQCTERIRQSSVIVCMIGADTHTREAVLWELNKAYELGKPVVGVRIYKDENHRIPQPLIDNRAPIVEWKTAVIQEQIETA